MEAFDKVEELLLAEGYSKEEIPAIMVSLVEQGFDPTSVFLGGIANMLDLLPKKKPPAPAPKVKPVADLLPDKLQPKAPKPEFGPNAVKPQPPVKTQPGRPGGITPEPQFRTNQPARNVNPARNNLFLQRTNLRAPSIPKPPAAVPSLFGRLKGVRGGPLTTAVNLATGAALDKYVVQPVAKAGGDALARGLLDVTGQGNRARQIQPSLYGKSGPDLTPDIAQGIRSREPRGMSNIPPAEGMVNNPNYGKPGTVQPKATPTPPTSTPAPTSKPAPPVPKLSTSQQDVNKEYDRLRKSDPAAAVRYGLRMARAGASKRSFTMPK